MMSGYLEKLKKKIYVLEKTQKAAIKFRENFGHPDKMTNEIRERYEEHLRGAAKALTNVRLLLSDKGLVEIPYQIPISESIKEILEHRTKIHNLVEELYEERANLVFQNMEPKIQAVITKDDFLESLVEGFFEDTYKNENFDPEIMWEIFDEAKIPTGNDYLERKIKISPILIHGNIDPILASAAEITRSLFVLGQWGASIILCRSVLEMVLEEIERRQPYFSRGKDEKLIPYFKKISRELLPNEFSIIETAAEIIDNANKLIHGKKSLESIDENYAKESIHCTFHISGLLLNITHDP